VPEEAPLFPCIVSEQFNLAGAQLLAMLPSTTRLKICAAMTVTKRWAERGQQTPATGASVLLSLFCHVVSGYVALGLPLLIPPGAVAECLAGGGRCLPFIECGRCGLTLPRSLALCPSCGGSAGPEAYARARGKHAWSN
jgi:hypothetical protein